MFNKFFQNTCKPQGLGGKVCVKMMNVAHSPLAKWGHSHVRPNLDAKILDIGCGGGANIAQFLKRCPQGKVIGIDYSATSVEAATSYNMQAINENRCSVIRGNVAALPFKDNAFNLATAFETVYFWPGLEVSFGEVFRVLKPEGVFMLCNEVDGENGNGEKWTKIIKGMNLYNKEELMTVLTKVGFKDIAAEVNKSKGWLCITANK